MNDTSPGPDAVTRRPVGRRMACAVATGVAIVVCLLGMPSPADAGTPGARAAAQPTTTPEATADNDQSRVSFRVVRDAEQPLPPPPPGMPVTGLDLPVYALAGGGGVLIGLGALLVFAVRRSHGTSAAGPVSSSQERGSAA